MASPPAGMAPQAMAQHSAFPDGPSVTIIYRKPCTTEKDQLFGAAPHGVEADRVVKAICRALQIWPADLRAILDPDHPRGHGDDARCYIVDSAGARLAHVSGVSFAWLNVEASRLDRQGWKPGLNAEVVS